MRRDTLSMLGILTILATMFVVFCIVGCSHKVVKDGPSIIDDGMPAVTHEPVYSGDQGGASRPRKLADLSSRPEFQLVYFDYDRFNIRPDQKALLSANAAVIQPGDVLVEGHCDERGTTSYNLALGQRRANAVKSYLMSAGVQATINTISYGKERPVNMGHDESAWARNRRAEIKQE